jgi:hypothetical protein
MNWSSLQIAEKIYLNWLHYLSFFSPWENRELHHAVLCWRFIAGVLEGLQNHSENHYQNWRLHHSPLVMVFEIVSVFCILSNPDFSCLVFSLGNLVSAMFLTTTAVFEIVFNAVRNLSCLGELSSEPLELHLLFCRLRTFRE